MNQKYIDYVEHQYLYFRFARLTNAQHDEFEQLYPDMDTKYNMWWQTSSGVWACHDVEWGKFKKELLICK